jgi:hypothetical protein
MPAVCVSVGGLRKRRGIRNRWKIYLDKLMSIWHVSGGDGCLMRDVCAFSDAPTDNAHTCVSGGRNILPRCDKEKKRILPFSCSWGRPFLGLLQLVF